MTSQNLRGQSPTWQKSIFNLTVIVSALGYFVDIYDLVLFSIVRVASLKDLGVPAEELLPVGIRLINMQMGGMLVGGLLWGILGDKKGRISVLFGSIVLYSLANIANAFVTTVDQYAILRFIAGVGLAGELGAAVTLVSETLSKEHRGIGTSFVAGFGVSGAMLAAVMGEAFSWRTAYVFGGVLGLLLLVLRVKMFESGMYNSMRGQDLRKGDFFLLFKTAPRFFRYICCIAIGLPIWYVIGILVTFSPEICTALGATGTVSAGSGILFSYAGLVVGDIGSGLISQYLRSRRVTVLSFIVVCAALIITFLFSRGQSPTYYYFLCFLLGTAAGYWALFVTIAAEQFGTNMRATVATTVPNFVRGAVVPLTLSVQAFKGSFGLVESSLAVGLLSIFLALAALHFLQESFGRDLEFFEH